MMRRIVEIAKVLLGALVAPQGVAMKVWDLDSTKTTTHALVVDKVAIWNVIITSSQALR